MCKLCDSLTPGDWCRIGECNVECEDCGEPLTLKMVDFDYVGLEGGEHKLSLRKPFLCPGCQTLLMRVFFYCDKDIKDTEELARLPSIYALRAA